MICFLCIQYHSICQPKPSKINIERMEASMAFEHIINRFFDHPCEIEELYNMFPVTVSSKRAF